MAKKLQIKARFGHNESVVDIEEAESWDYDDPSGVVVVENQLIRSYEELCALASQEGYRDKETLDVYFLMTSLGG